MKKIFGKYILNAKKIDEILKLVSSEDKETIAVGGIMLREMFNIKSNIIRNTVNSLIIGDKISFTRKDDGGNFLEYGTIITIGKENIIVETDKCNSSLIKERLERDKHFSILSQ